MTTSTKMRIDFGDELKYAEIDHPNQIPVSVGFDERKIVGTATIQKEDNLIANITLNESIEIKDYLEFSIGGIVKEREGNIIKSFGLKSIGIHSKL